MPEESSRRLQRASASQGAPIAGGLSGVLHQADGITVGIGDSGRSLAAPDVLDARFALAERAAGEHRLDVAGPPGRHYDAPGRPGETALNEEDIPLPTVTPYLNFDGDCEEAFELYRSILGGEFVGVNRYSEMPPEVPISGDDANKIMHIALLLADGQGIMGSDRPPGLGGTTFGDSVHVSISPDSAEDGRRIFEALSSGGQVTMPYERQFWGADYGMCTDRYGIHWMVNYDASTE